MCRLLVELMYRADWTSLSLALEVRSSTTTRPGRGCSTRGRRGCRNQARRRPGPAAGRRLTCAGTQIRTTTRTTRTSEVGEPTNRPGNRRQHAYWLLIAPGSRFRADDSDGQFAGSDGQPGRRRHEMLPPCLGLLLPGWLPARFELELAGPALVAGRPAHRLIGRPWPVATGRRSTDGGRDHLTPDTSPGWPNLSGIDRVDVALDAELGILLRCELMHRGQLISRSEITALRPAR